MAGLCQSLRKLSWHALHDAAAGPNAAFNASTLPALAAVLSLPISSCILSDASLYLAASFQISGLARVSPLSVPSPKAAHGSLLNVATISALSAAALAS